MPKDPARKTVEDTLMDRGTSADKWVDNMAVPRDQQVQLLILKALKSIDDRLAMLISVQGGTPNPPL